MDLTFTAKNMKKTGWVLALAMTAAAVFWHVFSMVHAGGLWRDEVGLVNIATLPVFRDIFPALLRDHCPIVFPAILRFWADVSSGLGDAGLRFLGLLVGFFLLGSFWFASRMMGRGLPLLALSLAALNPVVIRYGDSLRGYGFGMAVLIITMALIWRFMEQPDLRRGLLAAMAAVVSVQTLYQNAFFLLAICVGGLVVCLRQKRHSTAVWLLVIGFVAALSLVPYLNPIRHAQNWYVVSKLPVNQAIALDRLVQMTDSLFGVWLLVVLLAAIFGIGQFFAGQKPDAKCGRENLPLFAGITLLVGMIGFAVFLKSSGMPTQVWYYTPLLCFTAVCCDLIFPRVHPATATGVLIVVLLALIVSPATYFALRLRQTNGDLVARQIAKVANADDLIIVHPWHEGVTFAYYYHGAAKWTTLPPITDYRYFRYDFIKEQLRKPHAIDYLLEQVQATLCAGHRVWIVGELPKSPRGATLPADPPVAPSLSSGWLDQPYSDAWGRELAWLIHHRSSLSTVPIEGMDGFLPVNPLENMAIKVASGWRTNTP